MNGRVPKPSLFPYTTLFRSVLPQVVDVLAGDHVPIHVSIAESYALLVGVRAKNVDPCGITLFVDRKSKRLNSSHSQISYAVFCFKKKNTRPLPAHFPAHVEL